MDQPYEQVQTKLGTCLVTVYKRRHEGLPLVVMNSYMEAGDKILASCMRHGCPAFQLLSVSQLAWDEDLSPWPEPPTVSDSDHFTGGAKAYCDWLHAEVLPYARKQMGRISYTAIAGYSMGGLFAVYAPYVSDDYERSICVSGSLWYPGFLEYAMTTPFCRKPEAVYFSIGNQESRTKHPALSTTQPNMEKLSQYYSTLGIDTTFELNPGNHYQDAAARIAKGLIWTLRQQKTA